MPVEVEGLALGPKPFDEDACLAERGQCLAWRYHVDAEGVVFAVHHVPLVSLEFARHVIVGPWNGTGGISPAKVTSGKPGGRNSCLTQNHPASPVQVRVKRPAE